MAKRTRTSKRAPQNPEQEDVLRRTYRFLCRLAYDLDPSWQIAEAEELARDVRTAIEEEEDRWSEVFRAHLREQERVREAEIARLREAATPAPVLSLSARLREAPPVACACADDAPVAPAAEVSR